MSYCHLQVGDPLKVSQPWLLYRTRTSQNPSVFKTFQAKEIQRDDDGITEVTGNTGEKITLMSKKIHLLVPEFRSTITIAARVIDHALQIHPLLSTLYGSPYLEDWRSIVYSYLIPILNVIEDQYYIPILRK